MAYAVKRPFVADEELAKDNIIDLTTSDDEEARPPKRQRSDSYSAPKALVTENTATNRDNKQTPPTIDGLSSTLSNSSISGRHAVRDGNTKMAVVARHFPGDAVRPMSMEEIFDIDSSQAAATRERVKNAMANSSCKSVYAPYLEILPQIRQRHSNARNSLTFRPSPVPAQKPTIDLSASKEPRYPLAVDLDTDSDRASKKARIVHSDRKSMSSHGTFQKGSVAQAPNFVLPDTKPIKFDTSAEVLSKKYFADRPAAPQIKTDQVRPPARAPEKNLYNPQKAAVRVILPPHPVAQQQEVIRKLKSDVTYIERNAEHVTAVTGVRPFDNKDLTEEVYNKAIQKKHQDPVNRAIVALDFGDAPLIAPSTTDKPGPPIHPRKQTRSILNGRFQNHGQAPLTFENRVSDRRINGKFQFISNYVFSRGIQRKAIKNQTPHPFHRCQCIEGVCAENCQCLISQQIVHSAEGVADVPKAVQTYQRHPTHPGLIILSDALISDTTHTIKIFECNDYCQCAQDKTRCINRVVQSGRTLPLQIFETGKYGFGVRSSVPIVRGQFIDIYLGEVLTESEVSKREAAAEEDTPSYIMSLDAFIHDEDKMFYIDGENFGSVTRFVNHSCEPNCKIIPVVLPKGTKHLYYVAFFAVRDIKAGEELTIDYDPDLIHGEDEVIDGVVLCQCGSAKCRKRLWAPGKEKRGRRKKYLHGRDDE